VPATAQTPATIGRPQHLPRTPVGVATAVQRRAARIGLPGLLGLLAVYLPFYVVFFSSSLPFSLAHARAACGGRPVLDTRWWYGTRAAHDYLAACGPAGRAAITHQQLADLIYPALYAGVLTVAFALLLRAIAPVHPAWNLLIALPLLTGALDYLENVGVWSQLLAFPSHGPLVPFFATVTGLKQGLGYACIGVLAALLVTAGITRWRRRAHLARR